MLLHRFYRLSCLYRLLAASVQQSASALAVLLTVAAVIGTPAQARNAIAAELVPSVPATWSPVSGTVSSPVAPAAISAQADRSAEKTASDSDAGAAAAAAARANQSFTIELTAPSELRSLLNTHLELRRYQKVADLDDAELRRLLALSETNIRQLLATQGYFMPTITQQLDTPPAAVPAVRIVVESGPQTRIGQLDLQIGGAIAGHATARPQLAEARANWGLPVGDTFTQARWGSAKSQTLRALQAERFAAARLTASKAEIDPDNASAHLQLQYDSGPVYRYGPLQISGPQRYAPVIAERLAQIPQGKEYNQRELLDAQQRLLDSGYYNGAFVTIDTRSEADPQAAPVLLQLQEARLQKLVFGVGLSTDRGPRTSVDYTHNQIPALGWRGVTKLQIDRKLQEGSVSLLAPPDHKLWRWLLNGSVAREKLDDLATNSQQLKFGRTKHEGQIDRIYYLQYDRSVSRYTGGAQHTSQAISANYAWVQRRFNSTPYPTGGYGLGLEGGVGYTLQPQRTLFTRVAARYLGFFSLDRAAASIQTAAPNPVNAAAYQRRNGELVLRAETSSVQAKSSAVLPTNLLSLTGGDSTVRGYGYQELGVTNAQGLVEPGRHMVAASLEYRRPLLLGGHPSDWDTVAFIDAGAVANSVRALRPLRVGVGVGALWRSPVGPVQLSLAYGVHTRKVRLHMNLGFNF